MRPFYYETTSKMHDIEKDTLMLDKYSEETVHFYGSKVTSLLEEMLREQTSNSQTFLLCDLGCGDGATLFALYSQGFLDKAKTVVGVDISPRRIERLRYLNELGLRQLVGYVSDARSVEQLPDESFDIVICSQLIEHVQDDNALAAEVRRLMKSDGKAYISSVIRRRPRIGIYRSNGKWVLDPTHLREYASDKVFKFLLERNGLLVVKTKLTPCRITVLGIAIRLLIKTGFLAPERARFLFIKHRFLNALWAVSFPIPGSQIIEVVCRKDQPSYER
jgi:2-polyprenyl-3-methyl-5-hydroxy-6-metoxy-1,4-benzoquinol methylase